MKLVFATHNKNKFKEVKSLMPAHIELLSLTDIDCHEEISETSDTLEGNALIKAHYVKKHYNLDCFADDTGLEVAALNNAPGVYSARYAGPECIADHNMDKLLANLQDKQDRTAHFKTIIALLLNEKEILFTGICEGSITTAKTGIKGFGYDPIFLPKGKNETFAQMPLEEKNAIGHRGKAIQQLITHLSR